MEIIVKQPETKKIDLVNKNFSESQSWLQSSGYLTEFPKYFDLYRGIAPAKKRKWMSNRFIPMTFSKVETAISTLQSLLFASNPPFQIKAFEQQDQLNAQIMQKLLMYQTEQSKFQWEYTQFLRSLCIYGTAIAKVCWEQVYSPKIEWVDNYRPIINPITGMVIKEQFTGQTPQEVTNLTFNGPKFMTLNIADVFPDPMSIEIQDGWIIHRTKRSLDYLRTMHENYPDVYNEEILKLTDEDVINHNKAMQDTELGLNRLSNMHVTRPEGSGDIELYERWGLDIDPKDGKLKSRVLTVAAGKYLIRDTNNPYWHQQNPFIKGTYIPSINDFYGIGVPELLYDMQILLNENVNQRNDNISLALNRIMIYKRASGIKMSDLRSEPGHSIGVDEEIDKCIRYLDTPIYTRDSFMQTNDIERYAQEASAVTKLTLGMGGKDQNDTATGMSILQKASGDRFMSIARVLEDSTFKPALKMYYDLDYQYMDLEYLTRIVGPIGEQFVKVSPEEVQKGYDIVPAGTFTMENKGQRVMKLLQFKQATQGDPTIRQTLINREIYKALELGDNPDELMRPDAEMNEIMGLAQKMADDLHAQMMAKESGKTVKNPGVGTGNTPNSGQKNGLDVGVPGTPPPSPMG